VTMDLSAVIQSGMCIGCGSCVAADPTLELVLDEYSQSFRPSHESGRLAASVCPAVAVDFAFLHQVVFPGLEPGPHGVVDSVLLAQSRDLERNLNASSGGVIKELMLAYLEDSDVDGIITLAHTDGIEFAAQLITEPSQVDELPGSIYHAVPFDGALRILASHEGRFVLVAIPCQLEGILTYIHRVAPYLAGRLHATIGLLCGWQYTHHALRAICEFKGVPYDKLTSVAWRGGGPVGKLRLTTPSKEVAVSRRVDFSYQVAFDRSFNIPRCHLCVNHSNFLADIVVGDAWLPSTVYTRTGISLVVCRKQQPRKLVDRLADEGRLIVTEASTEEVTESQGRRVVFGDFAYAYQEFLASRELPRPVMEGPNRLVAHLQSQQSVESFHKELVRKLELQASRRYRRLWWRKVTREFPGLLRRYITWFFVRILKIKSLVGRRAELSSEQIQVFR
jgi:coenzyme F420-reducing hydrogenase beta subunit